MRVRPRHVAVPALAAAACLLAGCLGGGGDGTKAGRVAGPVILRAGVDDPPGKPGAAQLADFARHVEELSGGDIRIEQVLNAGGEASGWDQRVARMTASGELDLALVPTRAWDTEGVTTLRALNAPFLITGDALLHRAVTGHIAEELMSGLRGAGVVPLALIPVGLRHPFAFGSALRGPDDYEGREIRAPRSETVAALFAAFGATVADTEPDAGVQAGMESSYEDEPVGTATGNVTFFPKVHALVMDEDAYDDLDGEARDVLTRAAAGTRQSAIDSTPSDDDLARDFCAEGGAVVLAGDADLAALERAAAPVLEELARDATTRALIEEIRRLEAGTPPPTPVSPCGDAAITADDAAGPGKPNRAVDGVYRFEITDRQLRAAGVTERADLDENHGVYTVTLAGGRYCWEQRAPNQIFNTDECSTYELDGDRMVWRFPIGEADVYRWRRLAGGDLRLAVVRAARRRGALREDVGRQPLAADRRRRVGLRAATVPRGGSPVPAPMCRARLVLTVGDAIHRPKE